MHEGGRARLPGGPGIPPLQVWTDCSSHRVRDVPTPFVEAFGTADRTLPAKGRNGRWNARPAPGGCFPCSAPRWRWGWRSCSPRLLRPTPGRTAPADPAFVQYLQDARGGQDRTLGLVPAPIAWTDVPRTHFAPLMARFPDRFAPASTAAAASPQAAVAPAGVQTAAAPATYDLRTAGKLSPVRDQGRYGTCWAFAVARLARVEPPARRGERLLREQHGQPLRVRPGLRRRRQQLHGGGLPAALGRPRERGGRPLRSLRRDAEPVAGRRRRTGARARSPRAPRAQERRPTTPTSSGRS